MYCYLTPFLSLPRCAIPVTATLRHSCQCHVTLFPCHCHVTPFLSLPRYAIPSHCHVTPFLSLPRYAIPCHCQITPFLSLPRYAIPVTATLRYSLSLPNHAIPVTATLRHFLSLPNHAIPVTATLCYSLSLPRYAIPSHCHVTPFPVTAKSRHSCHCHVTPFPVTAKSRHSLSLPRYPIPCHVTPFPVTATLHHSCHCHFTPFPKNCYFTPLPNYDTSSSLHHVQPLLQTLLCLRVQARTDCGLSSTCHNVFSVSSPTYFSDLSVYIQAVAFFGKHTDNSFGQRSFSYVLQSNRVVSLLTSVILSSYASKTAFKSHFFKQVISSLSSLGLSLPLHFFCERVCAGACNIHLTDVAGCLQHTLG